MAAKHLLMKNNVWDVQSTSIKTHTASHRGLSQGAAQAHQRGSHTQQKELPEGKAQIWAASSSLGVFQMRTVTFFTCTQPPGTVPGQPQHVSHTNKQSTQPQVLTSTGNSAAAFLRLGNTFCKKNKPSHLLPPGSEAASKTLSSNQGCKFSHKHL